MYTFYFLGWLCWRKRNRMFSNFDYAYITICFIGSTKPIFVLNHFINRKFYNCHFLVAKHLFDRKDTRQIDRFLPIEWRLITVSCYSLAFRAQATCLENRDRKTVYAKFSKAKIREFMRTTHIWLKREKF